MADEKKYPHDKPADYVPHEHDVVVGDKVVGRDPDPNIRAQLRREWSANQD